MDFLFCNHNTFKDILKMSFMQPGLHVPPSLESVIQQLRDNMLRTQSQANTTAILGFDNLVEQLKIFASQINEKNQEINRLVDLCKKHNINTAAPMPETPAQTGAQPKVKDIAPKK